MLFVDFTTHCLPCVKKKSFEPLKIDGIYMFSKQHTNKQDSLIFERFRSK
jgi:hypothetical protein